MLYLITLNISINNILSQNNILFQCYRYIKKRERKKIIQQCQSQWYGSIIRSYHGDNYLYTLASRIVIKKVLKLYTLYSIRKIDHDVFHHGVVHCGLFYARNFGQHVVLWSTLFERNHWSFGNDQWTSNWNQRRVRSFKFLARIRKWLAYHSSMRLWSSLL